MTVEEITCPVQAAADCDPEGLALLAPHRRYDWRTLHAHICGAETKLRQAGIVEGDLTAIALPTGPALPILVMALIRIGAVAFPINTRFPAVFLINILDGVRCRNIIVPYGASIATVHAHLYGLAPHDLVEFPENDRRAAPIPLRKPATIVLTSGSTGPPKAALLSFGNHYYSALRSNRNLPLAAGDRWLMSLPMYHVSGLGVMFRCLLAGATVVFSGAKENIAQAIQKYEITHVSLVATQLHRLMEEADGVAALRRLKAILVGGGPIPESLMRRAHAAGLPLFTTYGLTEMASQVATTRPGDPIEKLLSAGSPLHADTVRISPEGEILVRGETLFLGYVEGHEIIRPFTEDNCFATRDLGRLDADGYLHITGRKDNMFIAGGENIQPECVEAALCRLDDIVQAVVVPVPHEEFGCTPVAFVRLKPDTALDPERFSADLARALPHFMIPRRYFPWPEQDPASDAKIARKDLAALARRLMESSPWA